MKRSTCVCLALACLASLMLTIAPVRAQSVLGAFLKGYQQGQEMRQRQEELRQRQELLHQQEEALEQIRHLVELERERQCPLNNHEAVPPKNASDIEDGQTYWRRVLREQYGVTAPASISVLELIDIESRLANGKITSANAKPSSIQSKVYTSYIPPMASEVQSTYLGKLSSNPYDSESISNPYSRYGSSFGQTVNNPFSSFGSPFSPTSITNPYTYDAPRIYASDGTYLGKLSSNRYDQESISNPYGRYGNPYGNTLANPYSKYGSPYSTESWMNPYTQHAPSIYGTSR